MQRAGLVSAWLVVLLVATLLTLEGWLPGNVLLPLTPDDFPTWSTGRSPDELNPHPHPNWCMADVLHLLVPGLATTRRALDRRELPSWDPSQALGVPHIDEVQYSVYYPPAWIPLLIGFQGLAAMAWLHIVVAAGGMLMYLRALGRTPTAAITGALAFGLSAWMTARLQSFPVVGAAAWIPWMLWALELGARGKRLAVPYALAGCFAALCLTAGFPQVSLMGIGLAVFIELARFLGRLRRRKGLVGPPLGTLAALVLAGLLAAPQLEPTLDYLHFSGESARREQTLDQLVGQSLEWPMLKHLVVPDYYASAGLVGFHPLALGDLEQASEPVAVNRAEVSMGIGTLALILALAAMVFGRSWSSRAYSLLILLVYLVLLWPPAMRAVGTLPPLQVGNPKRLMLLSTFGLSVLAAGGVDLIRRQRLRVVALCWALALAGTAYALVLTLAVPSVSEDTDVDRWADNLMESLEVDGLTRQALYEQFVPRENFRESARAATDSSLLMLAIATAAILLFRPRKAPTERGWVTRIEKVPGVLAALVAVELLFSAFPMLRAAPVDAVTTKPLRIDRLRVPALASAARAVEGKGGVPPRIARLVSGATFLRPNFPGLFGLHDVQAYAPMLPLRVAELMEAISPGSFLNGSVIDGFDDPSRLELPAVDMLGIDVVLTEAAMAPPPGFVELERVGAVRLLHNTEALPRAWHVDQVEVEPILKRRLLRLASREFDPARVVVLEDELEWPAGARRSGDGAPSEREVTIASYQPGRLELDLAAGAPGVVVVSETWHPDWTATVDARPVEVVPANHALIGIPVEGTGPARVEVVFTSRAEGPGSWMAGAGILVVLFCLVWGTWRGMQELRARRADREARAEPIVVEMEFADDEDEYEAELSRDD